ncbi:MAG: hypothetical protein ACLP9L_08515 [Thermoguttaceae bacterium]
MKPKQTINLLNKLAAPLPPNVADAIADATGRKCDIDPLAIFYGRKKRSTPLNAKVQEILWDYITEGSGDLATMKLAGACLRWCEMMTTFEAEPKTDNSTENTHYVYAFFDPRDDILRYVGQGVGDRRKQIHRDGSSEYGVVPWIAKLKSLGKKPDPLTVVDHLTPQQANCWEVALIELVGREVNKGSGPLKNLAGGGKGPKMGSHSGRTRETLSASIRNVASREPTNKYWGTHRKRGKWVARISILGKQLDLGYYKTEDEAGYAYNVGIDLLLDGEGRKNKVDLEAAKRYHVEQSVWKVRNPARIRGAFKVRDKWRARIVLEKSGQKDLGTYDTQIEAAYAYNVGARNPRKRWHNLNLVDDLLPANVKTRIEANVSRLLNDQNGVSGDIAT